MIDKENNINFENQIKISNSNIKEKKFSQKDIIIQEDINIKIN